MSDITARQSRNLLQYVVDSMTLQPKKWVKTITNDGNDQYQRGNVVFVHTRGLSTIKLAEMHSDLYENDSEEMEMLRQAIMVKESYHRDREDRVTKRALKKAMKKIGIY